MLCFPPCLQISHKETHHDLRRAVRREIFYHASAPRLKSHSIIRLVPDVLLQQRTLDLCPITSPEVLFPFCLNFLSPCYTRLFFFFFALYRFIGSNNVSLEELRQPKESPCSGFDILTATVFYVELKPVTLQFKDTFLNFGPPCRPVSSPPDFIWQILRLQYLSLFQE